MPTLTRERRAIASLLVAISALLPGAVSAPSDAGVLEVEVSFRVRNVNRSGVACPSDAARHTVRGRLEGPAAKLTDTANDAVTVYLHSPALGARTEWRFDALGGYDYAREQALDGHVSLTVDRLGYGQSDIPHGLLTCYGSAADVADQIVVMLKAGAYESVQSQPITFERVALAGFSGGGLTAEIAAYSFGHVDALVVVGWAESGHEGGFALAAAADVWRCGAGGEPKRPDAASGYVLLFSERGAFEHWLFADADPAVLDAARAAHERDPCGELASVATALAVNPGRLGEIGVPVLLVYGNEDRIYPADARRTQLARFTGSDDVTLIEAPGGGHTVMLERREAADEPFRRAVSTWLSARGF